MPEEVFVLGVLAIVAGFGFQVLRLIGRAIDRKYEARVAGGDLQGLQTRLAALEREVAELSGSDDRVAELEERIDFAERMLTRERERIPPGQGA